jgi:Protein of unknown function (DUF3617)
LPTKEERLTMHVAPHHALPRLIALLCATTALAAGAQEKILPGLWEHHFSMRSESGRMELLQQQVQAQMALLPPAQRQQMEAMLARQGVALSPQGNRFQVCVTPQDAQADRLPQFDARCQQQVLDRQGNTVRFRFSCSTTPPVQGEGQYRVTSRQAYDGSATVNTVVQGQTERMVLQTQGRWAGADCGALGQREGATSAPR